jgi:sugar-phosphatase
MRAAIFDMDGVLIDSEPLWRTAEVAVFARVGIPLTAEDCEQTMGLRSDEVVAYWYERYPWTEPAKKAVEDELHDRVRELIERHGEPLPGVRRALDMLRGDGVALGLATSSPPLLVDAALSKLGLAGYFGAACSAVDEEYGKPDPAVYLSTADRLGVPAPSCVALEDSAAGVAAARAAGMKVVAVPAPDHFDRPEFDPADLKLRSLEQLSLELFRSL